VYFVALQKVLILKAREKLLGINRRIWNWSWL